MLKISEEIRKLHNTRKRAHGNAIPLIEALMVADMLDFVLKNALDSFGQEVEDIYVFNVEADDEEKWKEAGLPRPEANDGWYRDLVIPRSEELRIDRLDTPKVRVQKELKRAFKHWNAFRFQDDIFAAAIDLIQDELDDNLRIAIRRRK